MSAPAPVPPTIAVVDYGLGNLASVVWGLERAGGVARVVDSAEELATGCDGLVLPGVGSFGPAAKVLAGPLGQAVRAVAAAGHPVLGICLGMQLLFDWSEEDRRENAGLGLLAGGVRRLDGAPRLPHMGWNSVTAASVGGGAGSFLRTEILDGRRFYFAHSYVAFPRDPGVVAGETEYDEIFPSVVAKGNVAGVQFHPERSGAAGRTLIERFVASCSR